MHLITRLALAAGTRPGSDCAVGACRVAMNVATGTPFGLESVQRSVESSCICNQESLISPSDCTPIGAGVCGRNKSVHEVGAQTGPPTLAEQHQGRRIRAARLVKEGVP